MIPWRGNNGQFGFANPAGQQLVEPRFHDARPGAHGYAPAANADLQWGLVGADGRTVLPFDYAHIELIETARTPLVVTKQEYNAWWRFWDWRILPEYNILSTTHTGPTLVTYVPRATWRVVNPTTGETLYHSNRSDSGGPGGTSYWTDRWKPKRVRPTDLWIQSWPDGRVQLDHTLYAFDDNASLEPIASDIFHRLTNGDFLQALGNDRYQRLDANGGLIDERRYTERHWAPFETERGEAVHINRSHIFEDDAGRFYLFPDLSTPLPARLPDYHFEDGRHLTAEELTASVAVFDAVPHSRWFLLLARIDPPCEPNPVAKAFFFDRDGRWAPNWKPRSGFYTLLHDGRMLFRYSEPYGVLQPNLTFEPLPMSDMGRRPFGSHRYSGRDHQGRSGIYDTKTQNWLFRSDHERIQGQSLVPGVATYLRTGTDRFEYGLLDVATGEKIIPPRYASIERDGRVTSKQNGQSVQYYIDLHTGREYRSDRTPDEPPRATAPEQ